MNALIIDDDKSLRWILENILNKKFNVTVRSDGMSGLSWLSQGHIPDIIITDMNLPRMNGLDFLKSLKRSGAYKNIPVIIISGEDDRELKENCIKEGALNFIQKPFDPEELHSIIESVFKNNKQSA